MLCRLEYCRPLRLRQYVLRARVYVRDEANQRTIGRKKQQDRHETQSSPTVAPVSEGTQSQESYLGDQTPDSQARAQSTPHSQLRHTYHFQSHSSLQFRPETNKVPLNWPLISSSAPQLRRQQSANAHSENFHLPKFQLHFKKKEDYFDTSTRRKRVAISNRRAYAHRISNQIKDKPEGPEKEVQKVKIAILEREADEWQREWNLTPRPYRRDKREPRAKKEPSPSIEHQPELDALVMKYASEADSVSVRRRIGIGSSRYHRRLVERIHDPNVISNTRALPGENPAGQQSPGEAARKLQFVPTTESTTQEQSIGSGANSAHEISRNDEVQSPGWWTQRSPSAVFFPDMEQSKSHSSDSSREGFHGGKLK